MACFSRQGYRATSMEDIVRESGLSVGAIYTYYASKEDLFLALAERRTEETLEVLKDLFAQPGPLAEKLGLAVDFFFGQLEDHLAPIARVGMEFWSEASRSQKVLDSHCERVDSIRRFLQHLMSKAQESGEVRADVDVESTVELVMALHDGMLMHHFHGLQPINRARTQASLRHSLQLRDRQRVPPVCEPRAVRHINAPNAVADHRRGCNLAWRIPVNTATLVAHPRRSAFLATVLALATISAACAPTPPTPTVAVPVSRPAVAVTAEKATVSDIQQTVNLSGDIRSTSQISVLPKVSGRIQNILVDVGSPVKAGDVLAELEADNSELQVLQSRVDGPIQSVTTCMDALCSKAFTDPIQGDPHPINVEQGDDGDRLHHRRVGRPGRQGVHEQLRGPVRGPHREPVHGGLDPDERAERQPGAPGSGPAPTSTTSPTR